jgi:hypothetical protein
LRREREHLSREGGRIRSELRALRTSFNQVKNSEALQGQVKQAVDASIENQHIPIINALLECYILLARGFKDSINKWQEQVGGENNTAIMEPEALSQHLQILETNNREFENFDRVVRDIYARINEASPSLNFIALNNSTNGYQNQFITTRQHLIRTRIREDEFDYSYTELEDLITQTRRAFNNLRGSVSRSFVGEASTRLSMANSNTEFRELVEGITSDRENQERAMIENLRRQWLSQSPQSSYMNLPRPLDPAVLDAWLEHHGMTMNDLNIALSGGMVNGSNLHPILQWMADNGNGMNLVMSEPIGVASALSGYVTAPDSVIEAGTEVFLDWGVRNVNRLHRPIYVNLRNRPTMTVPRAHDQAVEIVGNLGQIGTALKDALPWIAFGAGTFMDVMSGDRTIGQAIAYNGGSTAVGFITGAGLAAVGSTPVGWVIAAGAFTGFIYGQAYEHNWLGVQTGVNWIGDQLDTGIDIVVEGLTNWAADSVEGTITFINNVGQAVNDIGNMINPFNWSWGN